jgi:hypothetical protein
MRPLSDEIDRRWHRLPPISIAWIERLKALGASVDALCEPELPAQAQVIMLDGFVFDFADEVDGTPIDAMIFIGRDGDGYPADLVAWTPTLNRMASLYGRAALLGEDEVFAPRFDPEQALQVHETPLQWLLAEREGVCIVDPTRAASLLRSAAPLAASSVAFGRLATRPGRHSSRFTSANKDGPASYAIAAPGKPWPALQTSLTLR